LDILKSLQPEKWHRSQVDEELDQAFAAIEDAEADFAKGSRRLESLRVVEANPIAASVSHKTTSISEEQASESTMAFSSPTEEMIVWMRRGFAFTLPLIGTMLLGLLLAKLMF
jgi:hypothetical protein